MYTIEFTDEADRNLEGFSARDRKVVIAAIEEQLKHDPTKRTKNRKPLRENPLADWELRVQKYRVLYNVDAEIVTVLIVQWLSKTAIGSLLAEWSIHYD